MKCKRSNDPNPNSDFEMFMKNTGNTPELTPLDNASQTGGTASPNTPTLDAVAIDATPQGQPSGSAESAAHADPACGPDTSVTKGGDRDVDLLNGDVDEDGKPAQKKENC